MDISLIIAVAENGVIGKDNQLIWRLSDDLKMFRKLTSGHSIIMGRKTYESIGKPLPNRHNIVLSRDENLKIEGCYVANTIEKAIALAETLEGNEEVFVIGGSNVYAQALPYIQKAYLTKVHASPDGDAFFDTSFFDNWEIIERISVEKNEKNEFDFDIITLKSALNTDS